MVRPPARHRVKRLFARIDEGELLQINRQGGRLLNVSGDPLFWASVSMLGSIGAEGVVSSDRLAKARSFGFSV